MAFGTVMYAEDSFLTLGTIQRFGLVFLSMVLFSLTVFVFRRVVRKFDAKLRILTAITLFFLFVWLSPQIYYAYYQLIFDELPAQIVIKTPPSPFRLTKILLFQEMSLSGHSKALLGWVLIIMTIWPRKR